VTMANSNLGLKVIRHQIASAIHLIIQVIRFSDGSRRITHVTECAGMEGDIITLQDMFVFERTGLTPEGNTRGQFRSTGIRPKIFDKLKAAGVELPLSILQGVVYVN